MIVFDIKLFLLMPKDLLDWLMFLAYADGIYLDIYRRNVYDRMEYYGTSRASKALLDTALEDIDNMYYRFAECSQ